MTDDLRQRIAAAQQQRAEARAALGPAGERIAAIAFDLATASRTVAPDEVYAAIAAHRTAVLAELQPELDQLREKHRRDLLASEESARILQRNITELTAELDRTRAQIAAIALIRVWRNEDGREFMFADDIRTALGVPTRAVSAPTT